MVIFAPFMLGPPLPLVPRHLPFFHHPNLFHPLLPGLPDASPWQKSVNVAPGASAFTAQRSTTLVIPVQLCICSYLMPLQSLKLHLRHLPRAHRRLSTRFLWKTPPPSPSTPSRPPKAHVGALCTSLATLGICQCGCSSTLEPTSTSSTLQLPLVSALALITLLLSL